MFVNYIYIYKFIYCWAGSSLLHELFSSCGKQGLLSRCGAQASVSSGFLSQSMGSRVCGLP